jgi:hypothetical protein
MTRAVKDKKTVKTELSVQAKPKVLYILFYYWRTVVQGLLVLITDKGKWEV